MATRFWALFLCVLLSLTGLPVQAQTTLSRVEARAFAVELFGNGQPAAAREIAVTLLKQRPDDFTLLLLLARADRALGRIDTATWASIEAWKAAETENQRFAAAMVRAQVLSSGGNQTLSQLWLRRAAEIAPNDAAREVAVKGFRYVRAKNPLTTRLSFGVRPSSNINNGSRSDTIVIGDLDFRLTGGALALSGVEYSYGVSTQYRKVLAPGRSLRFGVALDGRSYTLSDSAKRIAPDISGSDLAYISGELQVGTTVVDASGEAATHLDLAFGHNWYGGDPLSRFTRLTAARDIKLGDHDRLRFSLQLEDQHRLDQSIRSSQAGTLRGRWSRQMASGASLSFGLGWRETQSDSVSIAHQAALASVGWTFGEAILGAQTSLTLNLETRDYEGSSFGKPREDQRARFGISMLFRNVDYYGFAPMVNLTAERNKSNIATNDNEVYGLSIGVQSVF